MFIHPHRWAQIRANHKHLSKKNGVCDTMGAPEAFSLTVKMAAPDVERSVETMKAEQITALTSHILLRWLVAGLSKYLYEHFDPSLLTTPIGN